LPQNGAIFQRPLRYNHSDIPAQRGGSEIMRMLIVTLSAALMLLSIVPQVGAAKSHRKCGGDNLQCGNLAKVCNPKNGKCCCAHYGTYH
jgi:hypothetical protein